MTRLSQPTATIFSTRFSPAVNMAAMAACSAQKPRLQAVSMHTPRYTLPLSVTRAAATPPVSTFSETCRGFSTSTAFWYSSANSIENTPRSFAIILQAPGKNQDAFSQKWDRTYSAMPACPRFGLTPHSSTAGWGSPWPCRKNAEKWKKSIDFPGVFPYDGSVQIVRTIHL